MERLVARELMDDESFGTLDQWRGALHDLCKVNRFLGGWAALRAEVERMPVAPWRILDVGAGGADLSKCLLAELDSRGVSAHCIALDRSPRVLELARGFGGFGPALRFEQGDAQELPFADRSFDLAMMNLALHHFDPDAAVVVLRELARVATHVIVNDLRRSRIAWAFARFVFPLFTRNPLTRNDGPLSVRRAYSPSEVARLAQRTGWQKIDVRTYLGYRMTLAGGFA